jgi:hypothetical protein
MKVWRVKGFPHQCLPLPRQGSWWNSKSLPGRFPEERSRKRDFIPHKGELGQNPLPMCLEFLSLRGHEGGRSISFFDDFPP